MSELPLYTPRVCQRCAWSWKCPLSRPAFLIDVCVFQRSLISKPPPEQVMAAKTRAQKMVPKCGLGDNSVQCQKITNTVSGRVQCRNQFGAKWLQGFA
jgi:hypothetical protein